MDAYTYYRTLHPELTKQDVSSFAERYRNSADEQQDLLSYYSSHGGDLTHILQHIICSVNDDIPRFLAFFDEQIRTGHHIKNTKKFEARKSKIELLPDERAEAKKEKGRMKAEKEKK